MTVPTRQNFSCNVCPPVYLVVKLQCWLSCRDSGLSKRASKQRLCGAAWNCWKLNLLHKVGDASCPVLRSKSLMWKSRWTKCRSAGGSSAKTISSNKDWRLGELCVCLCSLISQFDRCLGLHNNVPSIYACVCKSICLNERTAVLWTCLGLMSVASHEEYFVACYAWSTKFILCCQF